MRSPTTWATSMEEGKDEKDKEEDWRRMRRSSLRFSHLWYMLQHFLQLIQNPDTTFEYLTLRKTRRCRVSQVLGEMFAKCCTWHLSLDNSELGKGGFAKCQMSGTQRSFAECRPTTQRMPVRRQAGGENDSDSDEGFVECHGRRHLMNFFCQVSPESLGEHFLKN
jgi:hypothetical protein